MKSYPLSYTAFVEHMKSADLAGLKCLECNEYIVPPNAVCPACGSADLIKHFFLKKGILRTFTIIRVGPTGYQVPYIVALAELLDGPWVMGNVVNIDPDKADIKIIGKEVSVGCMLMDNEGGEGPDEGFAFTFTIQE